MAYEKECVVFHATNVSQHSNSIDGVQQPPKHHWFNPYIYRLDGPAIPEPNLEIDD